MSATTSLVKQLVSEQSGANTTDSTDGSSGGSSLSEIKAAAKEGTIEALADYDRATQNDDDVVPVEPDDTANQGQSNGGSKLKKGALLGVVVVYLIRRRRSSTQSTDAQ